MKINKKSGILPPNHYLHALYTKKTESTTERSKIARKQLLCTYPILLALYLLNPNPLVLVKIIFTYMSTRKACLNYCQWLDITYRLVVHNEQQAWCALH
jgi:hypothetical protein